MGHNSKADFQLQPNAGWNTRYIEMAARLKAAGMSNADIALIFGFSPSTIKDWQKKHPLFKKAIEEGKDVAQKYVLAQAFRAACGYDYEECNEKFDAEGNLKEKSVFHKKAPPNPKLIMWLLCNMDKDNWKSEHKITVQNDKNVTVHLDGKIAGDQIQKLAGRLLDNKPVIKHIIDAKVTDTNTGAVSTDDTEGDEAEHSVPSERSEDAD